MAAAVPLLKKMTGWWRQVRSTAPSSASPANAYEESRLPESGERTEVPKEWAGTLLRLAGVESVPTLAPQEGLPTIGVARAALARFADDPQRLPRRPQMLPQLLGALNDPDASGRDIAGIIARDPALAANLLKLANSALYRRHAAAIESLDRAVAVVGVEGLRHLVAVALMQPVMRTESGVFGRLPHLIWDHTQHTAVIAAGLARASGREQVFVAQLAALQQGLGAIVVVRALRDACADAGGALPDAPSLQRLLQHWSPRMGGAIARAWGLSAPVIEALAGQRDQGAAAMGPLARVLATAAAQASAELEGVPQADAA